MSAATWGPEAGKTLPLDQSGVRAIACQNDPGDVLAWGVFENEGPKCELAKIGGP